MIIYLGCIIALFIILLCKKKPNTVPYEKIHWLLRQTARWAIASQQDKNPIISLLHANYAVGYLSALREIATDSSIYKATGVDIREISKRVLIIQDFSTRRITRLYPLLSKDLDKTLGKIAGDL